MELSVLCSIIIYYKHFLTFRPYMYISLPFTHKLFPYKVKSLIDDVHVCRITDICTCYTAFVLLFLLDASTDVE